MKTIEVLLKNEAGLHARPASQFVQECNRFESQISIEKNGKAYNAKSIMSILSLGIEKGTNLVITAEGADETEAVEALKNLVENNFGE